MKNRSHLRGRQLTGRHVVRTTTTTVIEREEEMPPPDPSTRVDVDFPFPASLSDKLKGQRGGELIVAAGLGGILVSVCSTFAKLLDLPSLSEKSVAVFGGVLVIVGASKAYGARSAMSIPVADVIEDRHVSVDLPTLTGQISGVLAQLRQEHGMAYRTRTWIEEILPAYGQALMDPSLARDLLAAAALDAGGIRADVAGLAESHLRDDIVETGCALLEALQNALAACEDSDQPSPRPSDPSCWPVSAL
jgi:hypothetical protein